MKVCITLLKAACWAMLLLLLAAFLFARYTLRLVADVTNEFIRP